MAPVLFNNVFCLNLVVVILFRVFSRNTDYIIVLGLVVWMDMMTK